MVVMKNKAGNQASIVLGLILLIVPGLAPNYAYSESDEVSEEEVEAISATALSAHKDAASRGRLIYRSNCLACHGRAGDGKGPAAQYLDPPPRDFTGALYKFRSTPGGELARDEDLAHIVASGVVRSNMPPFRDLLSASQIGDVVEYIKSFSEYYEDPAPEAIVIPAMGDLDDRLIEVGRNLYINLDCWTCHGPQGMGNGPSAPTLKDGKERPVKPMDLTRGDFKRGGSLEGIYKSIMTGLDGSPMPAHSDALLFPGGSSLSNEESLKGSFSEEEISELKSFLGIQPLGSELENMDEMAKTKLVESRGVALVHYVKSLKREPGIFYKLFVQG